MGSRIKSLFCLVPILMMLAVVQELSSQSLVVKRFSDKSLGGECVLLSAHLHGDRSFVTKSFDIEVSEAGQYYLHAWALSVAAKIGSQSLSVYIDDQKASSGILEFVDPGWQSVPLVESDGKTSKQLFLSPGKHTISFKCEGPSTPAIDFIRLSRLESAARIPNDKYRVFREHTVQSHLPGNYAMMKADSSARRLLRTVGNPEGEYLHELELGFSYTYYHMFYWAESGSQVTFETKKADPYASDPVMEFFNAEDPVNKGSWVDDDGGDGYQAKLTVTIPHSGTYYLLLWSYGVGTSGTSDLYLNGNLFASDIPLTHAGVRHEFSNSEELNYFTSWLTGDSRIWIEDQDGLPGKIRAYNDDFDDGSFNWGYNARVRKSLSISIGATQLSAYSSSNPTGECDLYMKCGSIGYYKNDFDNLDSMDAVRSAPSSNSYVCLDWSGGVTSFTEWPTNPGNRYRQNRTPMTHADTLASFDNYYGNKEPDSENSLPRYSGAWTYTSVNATSSNNVIDLWANSAGLFDHASVYSRWDNIASGDPPNGHAHGYDWESKHGGTIRFFHPRYAIGGDTYGSVTRYYKLPTGLAKTRGDYITSAQSIAAGMSVVEDVALSVVEIAQIDSLKKQTDASALQDFEKYYVAWKKTWTDPKVIIHSDPRKYAESKEYFEFLNFCIEQGKKVLPLLIEKLNSRDHYVIVALEDLTYHGNESMMREVHKENLDQKVDSEGAYIIHADHGNWMKYARKLFAQYDTYPGFSPTRGQLDPGRDESQLDLVIQSYPNPFNPSTKISYRLTSDCSVTVRIYDITGKLISVLVENEAQKRGTHTVTWDGIANKGVSLSSGVYFCRIDAGNRAETIRLMLLK